MKDKFFERTDCQRCHKSLKPMRTMSWFTEETICMECCEAEDELKEQMKTQGLNPSTYEGCGYIPNIENIIQQNSL